MAYQMNIACTVDIEGGNCEWHQSWCPWDSLFPGKKVKHDFYVSISLKNSYLQATWNWLHCHWSSMAISSVICIYLDRNSLTINSLVH